jgi:CMP-N-acetylneuraminic acid synthetase
MIKRSTWQQYPFDEDVTNIEDRIWGQKIISSGLKIAYEPEASVYHHHGIHQKGDKSRLENVVRILNEYEILKSNKTNFPNNPEFQEVCAIIPLRANNDGVDSDLLFVQETINAVKKSKYINRIILSTDSDKGYELGKEWEVEVPFIRPKDLSQSDVRIETVLKYSLEQLESQNYFPDIIVPLEITYPFRPDGLLDKVISTLCNRNFDTVIAGFPEFRPCWIKINEEIQRVDENTKARSMRHPTNIGLHSLACATYPEIIRKNGDRIGKSVGIIEVTNHLSTLEFRNKQDLQHFESLKLLFENTEKHT